MRTSAYLSKPSEVCGRLAKEADPRVTVKAIATDDETRSVLGTISKVNLHKVILLVQGDELVTPLDQVGADFASRGNARCLIVIANCLW